MDYHTTAQRPLVLVAMPLYNAGRFLRPALASVLAQTHAPLTILVADDGSKDGSLETAREFAATDPRVVVHALPHGGQARAANHCLQIAIEQDIPFIARMDADDLCTPERIARQLEYFDRFPAMAACGSNCEWIDEDGKIIGHSTVPVVPATVARELAAGYRGVIQGSAMFRTSALAAVGGYREHFELSEDVDLFLRLVERYTLGNVAQTLYSIRLHDSSTSVKRARLNALYAMYAVDCHHRRESGRPEVSFDEFSANLSPAQRFELWRHMTMLGLWRGAMTGRSSRLRSMMLAAALDPRRALARVRRYVESRQQR